MIIGKLETKGTPGGTIFMQLTFVTSSGIKNTKIWLKTTGFFPKALAPNINHEPFQIDVEIQFSNAVFHYRPIFLIVRREKQIEHLLVY